MRALDAFPITACNWLAAHPRLVCIGLCAFIIIAFKIAGTV